MAKILVLDDDDSLLDTITIAIKLEGHTVDAAYNVAFARELLRDNIFDLLILDVDLPDGSGFDVCKSFRESGKTSPVLMLTGHSEIEAKELGFNLGADDYLTKPFNVRELQARIKALLRRQPVVAAKRVNLGQVEIDLAARTIYRHGQQLHLQRMDFNLLEFFVKHPNVVLAQDFILQGVWESYTESGSEALRTAVRRIRKEIDAPGAKSCIENVYGVGYLLRLGQS